MGAVFTFSWFLLLGVVNWQAKVCDAFFFNKPDMIFGILPCMKPNEVGDWLAGGFAPLAFVWLVVTVLLQSRELGLQREELAATREVFVEQKELMKLQISEAQRSGNLIEEQTLIATNERNEQELKFRDASALEAVRYLKDYQHEFRFWWDQRKKFVEFRFNHETAEEVIPKLERSLDARLSKGQKLHHMCGVGMALEWLELTEELRGRTTEVSETVERVIFDFMASMHGAMMHDLVNRLVSEAEAAGLDQPPWS